MDTVPFNLPMSVTRAIKDYCIDQSEYMDKCCMDQSEFQDKCCIDQSEYMDKSHVEI